MPISASDLKAFYAADMSNGSTSGGRITFNQITSGALQCTFPHAFRAVRTTGNLANPDHRKLFFRNCNDADETGFAPLQYLFRPNPSQAWCYKVIGTQRSTRADLTGSEARYGAGLLAASVGVGATVLIVSVKHADLTSCFAVGRPIRIASKLLPSSTTGVEEEFVPTAVTVSDLQVTITIPSPGVANPYTAGASTDYTTGCVVFSVYYPASGELECVIDNWSESTGTVYDEAEHPVICDNIGTAEQTWTIARLSDTQFSCTGDTIGALPTGSTSSDYAPVHPATPITPASGKPFFTLEAAGWLTTIPVGYTLVFQTHPPAIPTHEFRCIPPACGPMAGDGITLCIEVETVAV
jgi:hypothetical protein